MIADEVTGSPNDEQLSISIRFVGNSAPNDKFLGFHECCSGVTGEAIAGDILAQLTEWQLDPQVLDRFFNESTNTGFQCKCSQKFEL